MNPYSSLCDDFGVYVYLNTKMDLPSGRETVLHYFDGLRKTFPQMIDFDAMNAACIEKMGDHRPARTVIGVRELPKPGVLLTVNLTAVTSE